MTLTQYLSEVRELINQRGHHGANIYELGTVRASTDLETLSAIVEIADEYLALIVHQRENFVEDAAENAINLACEAQSAIEELLERKAGV